MCHLTHEGFLFSVSCPSLWFTFQKVLVDRARSLLRPSSEVAGEYIEGLRLAFSVLITVHVCPSQYEGKGRPGACHHIELCTRSGHLPVCVHRHDHHWQEVGVGVEKLGAGDCPFVSPFPYIFTGCSLCGCWDLRCLYTWVLC